MAERDKHGNETPYGSLHYDGIRGFRWRLYYADNTTYDSAKGTWAKAPKTGVQVLMLFFEKPYRQVVAGFDYYRLPGGDPAQDKIGSLMPLSSFQAIYQKAMNDMSWPVR